MTTKLQILNTDGCLWDTQVEPGTSLQTLKELAFQHFYPNPQDISPFEFRFIHPTEFHTLREYHDVKGANLKDNDMLLFVQHRPVVPRESLSEVDLEAPTMEEITEATKNLPVPTSNSASKKKPINAAPAATAGTDHPPLKSDSAKDLIMLLHREAVEPTVDFQVMLRKMLISLASVMAVILEGNEEAEQICRQFQRRLKQRFQHVIAHNNGHSVATSPKLLKLSDDSLKPTPMGIVECIIALKRCEFQPDPKAVQSLKEMGFNEEQATDALRANKNHAEKAAEWLLNSHHAPADDADTGLETESHLFKALVANPTIRLGMSSPKMLLACLSIIDTTSAAQDWLRDPQASAIIQTIFQVYHTERHADNEEA